MEFNVSFNTFYSSYHNGQLMLMVELKNRLLRFCIHCWANVIPPEVGIIRLYAIFVRGCGIVYLITDATNKIVFLGVLDYTSWKDTKRQQLCK